MIRVEKRKRRERERKRIRNHSMTASSLQEVLLRSLISLADLTNKAWALRVGGGGSPEFKWQWRSKDALGFEIFDFGIFCRKLLVSIFWVAWFKQWFFWVFKTIWRFVIVPASHAAAYAHSSSGYFYSSEIGYGIPWRVKFWSRDFFGFWFLPPFNHPCHLKSGVPPWAWVTF